MRVDKLMAAEVAMVRPEATVRTAIGRMSSHGCGFLPVVDGGSRVVGVVTDRDAALALGTDDARPSERTVADVMTVDPHTCRADETVQQVLCRMRDAQVRRLPVVDHDGVLVGAISIDDLVPVAQNVRAGTDRVSFEQVLEAVKALSERASQQTRPVPRGNPRPQESAP